VSAWREANIADWKKYLSAEICFLAYKVPCMAARRSRLGIYLYTIQYCHCTQEGSRHASYVRRKQTDSIVQEDRPGMWLIRQRIGTLGAYPSLGLLKDAGLLISAIVAQTRLGIGFSKSLVSRRQCRIQAPIAQSSSRILHRIARALSHSCSLRPIFRRHLP